MVSGGRNCILEPQASLLSWPRPSTTPPSPLQSSLTLRFSVAFQWLHAQTAERDTCAKNGGWSDRCATWDDSRGEYRPGL